MGSKHERGPSPSSVIHKPVSFSLNTVFGILAGVRMQVEGVSTNPLVATVCSSTPYAYRRPYELLGV